MSEQAISGRPRQPGLTRLCVVGLGYVGLPLAYEFGKEGYSVAGLDVSEEKVKSLQSGRDPSGEIGDENIEDSPVEFTTNPSEIEDADIAIVTVPTPIDDREKPDLTDVTSAGETIGQHLTGGSIVVLESTVYPGATMTEFVPAIENASGLSAGDDFGVGYSPERIVPGDPEHGLPDVVKIVSAQDRGTLEEVAGLYESIVDAGVHRAPSIEVAEAAKCLENVQRDLNIALMNELAVACNHIGLDTTAIIEAAETKWNFHEYRPGLVGGHCIPVDPFYLIFETERNGFSPDLIRKAREANEYVPKHVGELVIRALNDRGNVLRDSRVLILGLAYKPNLGDVRTSAIDGVVETLREYGVEVVGHDPHANDESIEAAFGIEVVDDASFEGFDGVVIGTPHDAFEEIDFAGVAERCHELPAVVDVDGSFEQRVESNGFPYARL